MNHDKTALFETMPVPRAVATLAVPTVLGTLVMILYNMADTFFVGLLADPVQTASVSLAGSVLLAFIAVNNLFGTGAASYMSRALGRKDPGSARLCACFSFWLAVLCAVIIAAASTLWQPGLLRLIGTDDTTRATTAAYLVYTVSWGAVPAIGNMVLANMVRSEGEAMHSSIGVMSGCVLNILLDPFFILPQFLGMGAAGAGLATLISNCFALGYLLIFVLRKGSNTIVCLNPLRFRFRREVSREVFGVGVPASVQNLLNVLGTLILNNATAVYGAAAVSAMGISQKIHLMPVYLTLGATQGIMPLISYNYSSGNYRRMKDSILFMLKLTVVTTLILGGSLFLFAAPLTRAFIDNDTVVSAGTVLLRAISIGVPFLAFDFVAVAVYQAIGRGGTTLAFALCRKLVLEIPAIILLNRLWPLYGMGFAQPFAEFVLTIAAVFMLRSIFRSCNGELPQS